MHGIGSTYKRRELTAADVDSGPGSPLPTSADSWRAESLTPTHKSACYNTWPTSPTVDRSALRRDESEADLFRCGE